MLTWTPCRGGNAAKMGLVSADTLGTEAAEKLFCCFLFCLDFCYICYLITSNPLF